MKTWKLVSGILSIVLCLFVLLQSCAAGTVNALEESGEVSGSAGLIVSIMMLAGGIVSIVTRKGTKGGNIAINGRKLYGLEYLGILVFDLCGSCGCIVDKIKRCKTRNTGALSK